MVRFATDPTTIGILDSDLQRLPQGVDFDKSHSLVVKRCFLTPHYQKMEMFASLRSQKCLQRELGSYASGF